MQRHLGPQESRHACGVAGPGFSKPWLEQAPLPRLQHAGHEVVAPAEGQGHPMPANVQIALTSHPMRSAPTASALLDDFRVLCDQRQGRAGQHPAQTLPRRRRAALRRLERPTIRGGIQEMRFDVDTQPRRFKDRHPRRFITDHPPRRFVLLAPHHGHRDRALPLRGNVNTRPEACLPWSQRHASHVAAALPLAITPQTPWDAKAPGPPQPGKMFHAIRVGEPTSRSQDDRTPSGKPFSHLRPRIVGAVRGHTAARRCEDFPHQRHGAATIDERQAHHTGGMPQA